MEKELSLKEKAEGMIMSLIILFVMVMTIIAIGTSTLARSKDQKEVSAAEKKQ